MADMDGRGTALEKLAGGFDLPDRGDYGQNRLKFWLLIDLAFLLPQ
jgi:hypothetical protein